MRIMIDQAIPTPQGLFARLGEVHTFDGRSLRAADLADADALIVRSVTRVDAALLAGSRVRFVGTATSGIDHVDVAWLAQEGIRFAAARGCNARPVAEYVLTAILWLARQGRFDPRTRTLGVVGVGHTGSLVAQWAHALGMKVRLCDPPLQDAGLFPPPSRGGIEGGSSQPPTQAPPAQWLSKPDLLAQSDIITLHVPLTTDGPHATREMVDPGWMAAMKPGGMLINAARGEVVAEPALIEARRGGRLSGLVVDVWTGEPAINERLAAVCDIATPHIAGYSVEAKRRAVTMIYDALAADPNRARKNAAKPPNRACQTAAKPDRARQHDPATAANVLENTANVLENTASVPTASSLPPQEGGSRGVPREAAGPNDLDIPTLLDTLQMACSLTDIDARLRTAMSEGTLAARFDGLRREVAQRREFPGHRLPAVQFTPAAAEFLTRLGFRLESA